MWTMNRSYYIIAFLRMAGFIHLSPRGASTFYNSTLLGDLSINYALKDSLKHVLDMNYTDLSSLAISSLCVTTCVHYVTRADDVTFCYVET